MSKIFSLRNIIWFCALGLAAISGYFSVYGISKLFAGGAEPIIAMAGMLELSKLAVVAFLHNRFKLLSIPYKLYLSLSAVVLMGITSIGVYGYLTNAYQETAKTIYISNNEITSLDQQKMIFEKKKEQIDNLIETKTDRVRDYDQLRMEQEGSYQRLLDSNRNTWAVRKNIAKIDDMTEELNNEISSLSKESIALTDSVSSVEMKKIALTNDTYSSELGPLLYLSNLTGLTMDQVVNWFIIFLVAVFDPLAVSLVIAGNVLNKQERERRAENKKPLGDDSEYDSLDGDLDGSYDLTDPAVDPDDWSAVTKEENTASYEKETVELQESDNNDLDNLDHEDQFTILDQNSDQNEEFSTAQTEEGDQNYDQDSESLVSDQTSPEQLEIELEAEKLDIEPDADLEEKKKFYDELDSLAETDDRTDISPHVRSHKINRAVSSE